MEEKPDKQQINGISYEQIANSTQPYFDQTVAAHPGAADKIPAKEAEVPTEWKVGDVILGLYEVKEVHSGGMGFVYKVYHRGWQVDIAVKSPQRGFFQTEKQKDSFINECENWVKLGIHPNIVGCYYVRQLGGLPRVFAEFVDGGSLRDWIDNRRLYEGGPQESLKRILDIAIQMAWGLGYAHENGLIHQDVKPANVMMSPDGTARITDFGGGVTPAYCSPEQAGKHPISIRTDIWSWAVSVLEMFIGEITWHAGHLADEVLKDHVLQQSQTKEGLPVMPAALFEILQRCFHRNIEERPNNLSEVIESLKLVYQQVTTHEYDRPVPSRVEPTLDDLNNRAIGLIDLGRHDEAISLLENILDMAPCHLEATYNLATLLWRIGRITDHDVLERLKNACEVYKNDWRAAYLLAVVHMQRGDVATASLIIKNAIDSGHVNDALKQLFTMAQSVGESINTISPWKEQFQPLEIEEPYYRETLKNIKEKTLGYLLEGCNEYIRYYIDKEKFRKDYEKKIKSQIFDWGSDIYHIRVQYIADRAVSFSSDEKDVYISLGRPAECHQLKDVVIVPPEGLREDVLHVIESSQAKPAMMPSTNAAQVMQPCDVNFHVVPIYIKLAMSNDGYAIIVGYEDGRLVFWGKDDTQYRHVKAHSSKITAININSNGTLAMSGSEDGSFMLWNVNSGQCVGSWVYKGGAIRCINILSDNSRATIATDDGTFFLFDFQTGAFLGGISNGSKINCLSTVSQGDQVFTGDDTGIIKCWDLTTGKCIKQWQGHRNAVTSLSITPDGLWCWSCSSKDGEIRLWQIPTGICIQTSSAIKPNYLTVSKSGRWVSCGNKVWQVYYPEEWICWPISSGCLKYSERIKANAGYLSCVEQADKAICEGNMAQALEYLTDSLSIIPNAINLLVLKSKIEGYLEIHTKIANQQIFMDLQRTGAKDNNIPMYRRVELGKGVKMEMVFIPPGEFVMGSPVDEEKRENEEIQHKVTISKGFWLGQYEVTQDQYEAIMGNNPSHFKGPQNPVEQVSWDDAIEFCRRLSKKEGRTFALPTEAQWEYACRAGTTTAYCFGDNAGQLGEYGWYGENGNNKSHPVGKKKPNAWWLYDMHGNVYEWCQDWYAEDYLSFGEINPEGPVSGCNRVCRGGGWNYGAEYSRSAQRTQGPSETRLNLIGFRVCLLMD